jgi:alpha-acetolactate decarboxylase
MSILPSLRWSFACVLLLGCTRGPAQAPRETEASAPSTTPSASAVRWFGELYAIMHEGRTEAAVKLADVLPGPHAWGVGALAGLAGEVTILDDVVWLARPSPDGNASISHGAIREVEEGLGAALLVVANVTAWDEVPVTTKVPWRELDAFLETELAARGEALDQPVPLRIEGRVVSLRWHVVDGSKMQAGAGHAAHAGSAVSGVLESTDAELVGFFSRAHQGVFTHADSYSHFHVITRDRAVSGHVDGVDLAPGTRLLVPRRAND